MPAIRINLEGDGMVRDVPSDQLVFSDTDIRIGVLEGGMVSGLPSVGIAIEGDGKVVLGQTSLKLFLMAALAIYAKYGDAGTGIHVVTG